MLKQDEDFRHLAVQVHAQETMLDALAVALFAMVPPGARSDIFAQLRRNVADIGRKGALSDREAEFKADVRVRAQVMVEQKLAILESAFPGDEDGPED